MNDHSEPGKTAHAGWKGRLTLEIYNLIAVVVCLFRRRFDQDGPRGQATLDGPRDKSPI